MEPVLRVSAYAPPFGTAQANKRQDYCRSLEVYALDFRGANEPAAVKRARVRAVVPAVGNRLLVIVSHNVNREEHHKAFHSIN
jgi:hypothetical protein